MNLDRGSTRIYCCPICGVDTPHTVRCRKGDIYAVVCTNCAGGSLVKGDELRLYQIKWEDELRQILDNIEGRGSRDGDDDLK